MNLERLTSPEFTAAVETCGGVCLLPMGVIEKHGDHLPLGQDTIYIHDVCSLAAEREVAMVAPHYYFGQIHEARHVPGTLALGRLNHLKEAGLSTGIWWYADHPGHLQAEQVPFTAEKGEAIVADHVDHLAAQIAAVKRDTVAPELTRDFYDRNDAPSNRSP